MSTIMLSPPSARSGKRKPNLSRSTQNQLNDHTNLFNFEPDEVYMDQKLDGMTEQELLSLDSGLFKVSEVERVLRLPPGSLRSLALKVADAGQSPYGKWGIGNSPISHWVVRIKVFSSCWENEIKPLVNPEPEGIRKLPKNLSPEALCQFNGVIRLSELKGRFPFHQQSIKNQVRKLGDQAREVMGCWKENSHFYVDLQPFLAWMSSHKYR